MMNFPKLDRTKCSFTTHEEQAKADRKYWQSLTTAERLEYMEQLIWLNYGNKAIQGFQRVFEITERKPR